MKNLELGIVLTAGVAGAISGMLKVKESTKDIVKTAEDLKDKFEILKNKQKELENIEELRKKYVKISKEWLASVSKLRQLKKAYEKSGKSNEELSKQIEKQKRVVNELNKQKERQKHVFEAARSSIEKENKSLKEYGKTLAVEHEKLKKYSNIKKEYDDKIKRYNEYKDIGEASFNRGVKQATMLAAPLKIYMDVEESQADLRKMLGDEAQKYYTKLREISDNSPLSQVQVYEISGALAQSGIAGDEIVEYTTKANQIAVAFDMGTQEAGEFLAKTKAQLGLGKEELFKYADTINYLADNTAAQANQIVEVSQRVASLGGIAGVSKESVAGFGATLISIGKTPEVAATGLKQLYGDLMAGNAATKAQKKAFLDLGLNAEQIAKDMAEDGEGTIVKVLERIKQLPKHLQASTIKQIFGNEAIDSVAGLSENIDMLKKNLKDTKSTMANGAVEREYANRMNTLANQLKIVKNKVMNSLADLGLALAPSIKNLANSLVPMIEKLSEWIKKNPKLVEGIMKIALAIVSFNLVGGIFIKILVISLKIIAIVSKLTNLSKILGFVKAFSEVFSGLTKIFGMFKMLVLALKKFLVFSGPIGWVILIISGLTLLYFKCTWFRNFVNNMWKNIVKFAVNTWGKIKSTAIAVFNFLKPFISIVINNIISYFKMLATVVKGIWSIITGYIKTYIAVWKGIFNLFIAFFTGQWDKIPGIVNGIWESIKSGIRGFVDSAKGILSGLFSWFGNQWNNIKNTASSIVDKVNIFKMGKNYTGTNYWSGGLTQVAERGAELINIPGMSTFIANTPSVLNLPKGTQILNNSQTRNTLRDRISGLRNKASNLVNKSGSVIGGDNINITINAGNNSNPLDIARMIEKVLNERDNKKRRVAF